MFLFPSPYTLLTCDQKKEKAENSLSKKILDHSNDVFNSYVWGN